MDFDGDPSVDNRAARDCQEHSRVRDTDRHPDRWNAEASGTLGGASGRFRCGAAGEESISTTSIAPYRTPAAALSLPGRGASFRQAAQLGSELKIPITCGSAGGVARSFQAAHSPLTPGTVGTAPRMADVTGTATYNGIAVGRYAISGTLVANQGHGEFSANAQLIVNFDTRFCCWHALKVYWTTQLGGHPEGRRDQRCGRDRSRRQRHLVDWR